MASIENVLPGKFLAFIADRTGRATDGIDPRVSTVYSALAMFAKSDARREWLEQRERCKKAAFNNEFFTEKEKTEMRNYYQEPQVVNRLVSGVQGASAIATANNPKISVLPLRDSDPYLAELCTNALEHVWVKNDGSDVVYDATEEKNVGGIGCMYAKIDENKGPFGAVVFEEDEVDNWYWDENSKKRNRSDTHLIRAQLRSMAYIKSHYDLKDKDIVSIDGIFEEQPTKLEDTVKGEDAYAKDVKESAFYSPPAEDTKKARVWEIEAYMLRVENEHWAVVMVEGNPVVIRLGGVKNAKQAQEVIEELRQNGVPMEDGSEPVIPDEIHYWPRKLNNRYKMIIVGTRIIPQPSADTNAQAGEEVEQVKNPLGLDSDGDPVLPVVFYLGQRTEKAYYRGPAFYAFDANKSLCKRKAQYSLAVSKNLSAPLARDVSSKWRQPARPDMPGNELLLGKGDREPTRLQPGAVDFAAMTNDITEDKNNIDDAFMIPEVMRGKVPQNLERMSGRLGLALQDSSMLMQNPSIRGLQSTLIQLGKTVFALILRSWPRSKWEALVTDARVKEFIPLEEQTTTPENTKPIDQKNEELAKRQQRWEEAINKVMVEGISIIDFNVVVTAGSSLPTNRLLRQEEALEFFDKGLFDRKAAMEHAGHPNAKEVADRMDEREMQLAQLKAGGGSV